MIELTEEKIDGDTVKVRKEEVSYFKKKDLEEMKIRMETELAKVNQMLAVF